MIGWILCRLGLHEWWPRKTWPLPSGNEGFVYTSSSPRPISELQRERVRRQAERRPFAVCGRCPALKWR